MSEEKQCSVAFDKITSTFIIRIFGRVDENEVTRFFEEYENYVEQVYAQKKFNVIINVNDAAHYSYRILKLARVALENQKRRDFIDRLAAINEKMDVVDFRNSGNQEAYLRFFQNEKDALEYLSFGT